MCLYILIVCKTRQVRKMERKLNKIITIIVQEGAFIRIFFPCFSKFSDSLFKQISKIMLLTFDPDFSSIFNLCNPNLIPLLRVASNATSNQPHLTASTPVIIHCFLSIAPKNIFAFLLCAKFFVLSKFLC